MPEHIRLELSDLFWSLGDGTFSPADVARIEELAVEYPEVHAFYAKYMVMCGMMQWERASHPSVVFSSHEEVDVGSAVKAGSAVKLPNQPAVELPNQPAAVPLPPSLGFFSGVYHGTVGFFSQEVPFSILVATLIFGLGGLIGSLMTVTHYTQFATNGPRQPGQADMPNKPRLEPEIPEPKIVMVGQITGMVDCRWVNENEAPFHNKIKLHDKFAMKSGLLEITYHTGAKVILQGPCTYEVESVAGGYLSLGKLTARVEKKSGRGGEGERGRLVNSTSSVSSAPSSPSLPLSPSPPLFSVRTPTALVTDLGTEFGVEVDGKSGNTTSHVFVGIVRITNAKGGDPVRLVENMSALAAADAQGEVRVIVADTGETAGGKFVRFKTMNEKLQAAARGEGEAEKAYIDAVLADKPLGYWPLNEPFSSRRFADRSGNGFHGHAMGTVTSAAGPFGRSRAVSLDGRSFIDIGRQDRFALTNGFTVEAWVWIGNPNDFAAVLSVGDTQSPYQSSGWDVSYAPRPEMLGAGSRPGFCLTTHLVENGGIPSLEPPLGQWTHLAVVFDQNNSRALYLDGKHRASVSAGKPAKLGAAFVTIGYSSNINGLYWHGRLAHVAVYSHVLSGQQIQRHYLQSGDAKEPLPEGIDNKKGGLK